MTTMLDGTRKKLSASAMGLQPGAPRPDPATYLNAAAASPIARPYKAHLLAALDLRPGLTALDVGCGPGTDLADLAHGVSPGGVVIGIDHSPGMVDHARRRVAGTAGVTVRLGGAHALPLEDSIVDRARCDRVLQHVADPAAAIGELHRVTRSGAVIALADPDWATLVVDSPHEATSAAFTRFTCEHVVRNATVGRQLARLAADAGFKVRSVQPFTPAFDTFDDADHFLGLTRNAAAAVEAGALTEAAAQDWLTSLLGDPFVAAFTLFVVVAERPA